MKLLFDENLSFRLVEAIAQLFPGSIHITRTSLARGASDRAIWEYAGQNDFAIVTADSDFVTLANTLGHPPKVIHLENCDYPTNIAARVLSTTSSASPTSNATTVQL
jgi:predicted nuclease of predicted toxin-antitoxin system